MSQIITYFREPPFFVFRTLSRKDAIARLIAFAVIASIFIIIGLMESKHRTITSAQWWGGLLAPLFLTALLDMPNAWRTVLIRSDAIVAVGPLGGSPYSLFSPNVCYWRVAEQAFIDRRPNHKDFAFLTVTQKYGKAATFGVANCDVERVSDTILAPGISVCTSVINLDDSLSTGHTKSRKDAGDP